MHFLPLFLLFLLTDSVLCTTIPLRQQKRHAPISRRSVNQAQPPTRKQNAALTERASGDSLTLNDVHDLIYIANVTLGGNGYPVQVDTGSSDLWIQGQTSPLPNSIQSSIAYNLTYGLGWAYGNISYADVEFAGVSIKNQSYIDVSSANNPALGYGAIGILGLGFTSLSSIDALVNRTGSQAGRSLLFNAFNQDPSQPNFITFALQRTNQPDDDIPGTLTIGEYQPQYADVAKSSPIPTFPESSPSRWNVLLEAVLDGGSAISVSSVVPGAPANRAVVLLDTGTSYTYAPPEVCKAIYGDIPGAQFDAKDGVWFVPCDVEIDIALQINGVAYPIHPLDVSPYNYPDNNTCIGSFMSQQVSVANGQFDWLIGDNVLRSLYSVYDFGDFDSSGKMGNPYIKLLSLVDPNEASSEFASLRGSTAKSNINYQVIQNAAGGAVTTSGDLSSTLDKLTTYIPAMLGIMALNALVLVLILIMGIVYLCRRRTRSSPSRENRGRTSPVPLNPIRTTSFHGSEHYAPVVVSNSDARYEPVSMAFSDDTFVPPSPAFAKGASAARRPHSYAPMGSVSEENFSPPSPAFVRDQQPVLSTQGSEDTLRVVDPSAADRPKSIA